MPLSPHPSSPLGPSVQNSTNGWGPPMANILVTGLPQGKDTRAEVKKKLREAMSAYGEVVGLNWGNRRGSAYVGLDSPLAASKAIVGVSISSSLPLRVTLIVFESDNFLSPSPRCSLKQVSLPAIQDSGSLGFAVDTPKQQLKSNSINKFPFPLLSISLSCA